LIDAVESAPTLTARSTRNETNTWSSSAPRRDLTDVHPPPAPGRPPAGRRTGELGAVAAWPNPSAPNPRATSTTPRSPRRRPNRARTGSLAQRPGTTGSSHTSVWVSPTTLQGVKVDREARWHVDRDAARVEVEPRAVRADPGQPGQERGKPSRVSLSSDLPRRTPRAGRRRGCHGGCPGGCRRSGRRRCR